MDEILNGISEASHRQLVEKIRDDNIQHVKLTVQYRDFTKNKTITAEFQNRYELLNFINKLQMELANSERHRY